MDLRNEGIRVVIKREGDQYVAQCLEVDIGVQAPDVETLRTRLEMTLRAEYIARKGTDQNPFPGIDPAPQYFHDVWDKCHFRSEPTLVSGVDHGASIQMAMCA